MGGGGKKTSRRRALQEDWGGSLPYKGGVEYFSYSQVWTEKTKVKTYPFCYNNIILRDFNASVLIGNLLL